MDIVTNTPMSGELLDNMLKSAPGSYIIYKKNSTIYGISNTPGYDDVTPDTDAHTVFQAVADALTAGGQIAIKGPATYDMQDDWALTYSTAAPLKIVGIGGILTTNLDYNKVGGTACIKPKNAANNFWLDIENIQIDGYTAPTKMGVYLNESSMCTLKRVRIVGFQSSGGIGVKVANGYYNTFVDCFLSYCRTGYMFGESGTSRGNANEIRGGFIQNFAWSDGIGIHVGGGNTNLLSPRAIELFANASAEAIKIQGTSAGDHSSDNIILGVHLESTGSPIGIHFTTYTYRNLAIACRDVLSGGAQDFWKDDIGAGTTNARIYSGTVQLGEHGISIGSDTGNPTNVVRLRNYGDYLYLDIGTGFNLNNKILKDPKNDVDATLSGTPKVVEIDIGGTPYYFKVYPTKS